MFLCHLVAFLTPPFTHMRVENLEKSVNEANDVRRVALGRKSEPERVGEHSQIRSTCIWLGRERGGCLFHAAHFAAHFLDFPFGELSSFSASYR